MKILSHLSGSGMGGADRLALDVSRGLRERGHDVIWLCPSNCCLIPEAESSGLTVSKLDPRSSTDLSMLGSYVRFCNENGIDIINAHHSHGRHLLTAARFRGLKAKTVFTRHCISGSTPVIGALFYNFSADLNIAVSETVRKSLLRGGMFPKKVIRIYGGVDVRKYEAPREAETGEVLKKYGREGAFHIGIVARFEVGVLKALNKPTPKRHEVLFRALSLLPAGVDFHLLVIGPENERDAEALRRLAAYCGFDKVKMERISFCGFQTDMAPFYRAMDLNVLPSPEEGLGLAVIEGMAAGVPAIGAGAGGLKEIITDGVDGFLFRPGDPAGLAERIKRIHSDKSLRDSFVLKGKETAGRFDIKKTISETERAFFSLRG